MRLAIAPGPTVHWLFRSHDLPSKFSAIASRMCNRRNRAVKHMYVNPLLRIWLLLFQLFFLCLISFYRGNTWIIQIWKYSCYCMQINCSSSAHELPFLNDRNLKQECSVFYSFNCSCTPLYPEESGQMWSQPWKLQCMIFSAIAVFHSISIHPN